jgi:hypothetical protein
MKQLTPEVLQEAVLLINQLRSGELSDKASSEVVVKLNTLLLDPHWFDCAIDRVPELSAEEVVQRAFLYRPFQL